jgi:hypothetical protein
LALPQPRFLSPEHSALSLREAQTDAEYLDRFIRLLRIRPGLDTADFEIPRKPGLKGEFSAWVKKYLWKGLRYQHDRMAIQQNVINELVASLAEFEATSRRADVAALEKRVAELEAKAGRKGKAKGKGGSS